MVEHNLTERQQKWFASVRSSLERDTGKSLPEWVTIAQKCPETAHRARLKWLKEHHGLLQNRASLVLDEAFGSPMGWSEPASLIDSLWTDPVSRSLFEAINAQASAIPQTVRTARKGFTAWSRKVQYAATKPAKGGIVLGLAVIPETSGLLQPARNEGWSERLRSRVVITGFDQIDAALRALLVQAWKRS